jgi:hypothetical protein
MIDSEQVAPAERLGARRKLIDRHAADTGGGQHGPNAGSRIQRRLNAALVESLHDSDVREALHAAAAEDERNTSRTRTVVWRVSTSKKDLLMSEPILRKKRATGVRGHAASARSVC